MNRRGLFGMLGAALAAMVIPARASRAALPKGSPVEPPLTRIPLSHPLHSDEADITLYGQPWAKPSQWLDRVPPAEIQINAQCEYEPGRVRVILNRNKFDGVRSRARYLLFSIELCNSGCARQITEAFGMELVGNFPEEDVRVYQWSASSEMLINGMNTVVFSVDSDGKIVKPIEFTHTLPEVTS